MFTSLGLSLVVRIWVERLAWLRLELVTMNHRQVGFETYWVASEFQCSPKV